MRTTVVLALVAILCEAALAQPQRNDSVVVVPAPRAVTIDGDLKEWDLSGAIDCAYDLSMSPRFTLRFAAMHDKDALYLAAHFVDDTPMMNRHDPKVEPNLGWAGDCLQVRVVTDPKLGWPLALSEYSVQQGDPRARSDRICHLTMWYFTDRQEPVVQMQCGWDFHGTKIWTGAESGLAFRKDADGQGYTLEARIPWERLNAAAGRPQAGDAVAFTVQPLWGDAAGTKNIMSYYEVVRTSGFAFQSSDVWGKAVFSGHGNLPPAERPPTAQEKLEPLAIEVPLDDPQAAQLSAAVLAADGQLVRTLPVTRLAPENKAKSATVRWDGLDDDGSPLAPGKYQVRVLTHRGIGQRWVTSLHNAGTPPWRTDDNRGSWGGDHGAPIAAASDSRCVYLGWGISEAGWAVIAAEPRLVSTEKAQKLWGQHQILEIGMLVQAMATDGGVLFVAQDGDKWGQAKGAPRQAGVVLWDAATGSPVNFPFGKRVLLTSEYQPKGDDVNLRGIALAGDTLYCSLQLDDKIVAFNWKTGVKVKEYAVAKPCGLAVDRQGRVLAASAEQLVRIDPASGQVAPLVASGLAAPYGVAVDSGGRIYVTDRGKAMQVKVFDADGKPAGTIGKAGGRPAVGRYDPQGMFNPAGITIDTEGKVWVMEEDHMPKRVSVWSKDGKLLGDLLGPGAYAVEGVADEANPKFVNTHNVLFEVDYATGKARTVATLTRVVGRQMGQDGGFMGRGLHFRHTHGHNYVVHCGRGAVVVYLLGDDLVGRPVAAMGDFGHLVQFHLPPGFRARLPEKAGSFRWQDDSGDTLLAPEEFVFEEVATPVRNYWGPWVDDDLAFWGMRDSNVYKVAPVEWKASGMPVYPKNGDVKPLFTTAGTTVEHVLPAGESVYVLERKGGNSQTGGADFAAVSRYTPQGKRLWAYRKTWTGFALESPLFKPGYVIGAMKFIGRARLASGMELVGVNGYHGQFNLLSDGGLWVTALCKDNRYGPKADATTVWPENFSGYFFRNRDNGKVYLIAGDTDTRIWEITGLETIRTGKADLAISEADHRKAIEVVGRRRLGAPQVEPLVLRSFRESSMHGVKSAKIDAGGGREARAFLAYDNERLIVSFDVRDDSPMKNAGKDFAMLFKGGDACDVMLGTDPKADPKRTRPAAGDVRLLFAVMDDKPVCVLYAPVAGKAEKKPRTFSSPTGNEEFERVVVLEDARVVVARQEGGYLLEAGVPLAAIGLVPQPGTLLRGDLGVLFSDPGGSRTVLRAYYANRQTAIVNDIPSEARLEPQHWALLNVE